jgi:hypothetical protein
MQKYNKYRHMQRGKLTTREIKKTEKYVPTQILKSEWNVEKTT